MIIGFPSPVYSALLYINNAIAICTQTAHVGVLTDAFPARTHDAVYGLRNCNYRGDCRLMPTENLHPVGCPSTLGKKKSLIDTTIVIILRSKLFISVTRTVRNKIHLHFFKIDTAAAIER